MNGSSSALVSGSNTFARLEFVTGTPAVAVPIIIVLVVASIIGTFGNILILVSICKTQTLNRVECVFIASLAVSDIYVTTLADPMSIVAKIEGEEFFDRLPGLCKVIAFGCTIACINSLGNIALLNFNRYMYICQHKYYNKVFKTSSAIVMCSCVIGIGFLLVFLNYADIGDHSFDRKSLECIWDRMDTYPYTVVFSVTLVWIPVFVVGFSYLNIYMSVRRSARSTKYTSSMRTKPYSSALAKTLFIIYAIFTVCWIPYALLIVVDTKDTFPHELHVYITVWAHLHPSINWLVYYFTNKKFQDAFNRLAHLNFIFRCNRIVRKDNETSTSLQT